MSDLDPKGVEPALRAWLDLPSGANVAGHSQLPRVAVAITAYLASAFPLPDMGDGWQPIETAPRDGSPILCCVYENDREYGVTFICGVALWEDIGVPGEAWWDPEGAYATPFTHWRPLPAPPRDEVR